ncbi:MAG TPA: ADP-glyceromanno-heptose 6-epimerase [Demequina sp.]|nr:ADP-glyceromanno-heptose 6-epimerase [Demequina sp.]
MSDTIIVTGAAGFIGRNIVAALNDKGHRDILLVDELGTSDKWRNLRGLDFDEFISPSALMEYLDSPKGVDVRAIIHMGACSATTERDADYLVANNYRYTLDLITWSLAHNARMIYASSAATYGDGSLGYSDADDVTPTLRPLNMYGYSKQMVDEWALRNGLLESIVGLKFFNVYGPYEEHKGDMRSLVSKAYRQVRDTGQITLFRSHRPEYAHGEQMRDFIYVDDAVDVVLYFLDHPEHNGLFNCGTSHAATWLELTNALFGALGRQPQVEFVDMPEAIRDRYQYFTEADGTKLREAGYPGPFRGVDAGVREYVETFLSRELADD